jgi:hypothetical protein
MMKRDVVMRDMVKRDVMRRDCTFVSNHELRITNHEFICRNGR